MKLRILNEDTQMSNFSYGSAPGTGLKAGRFNKFLTNNNPITYDKREYVLEVEGLPYSLPGHKEHNQWVNFLKDNPHVISNFDTRDPAKLSFLFERWKIMHNNG